MPLKLPMLAATASLLMGTTALAASDASQIKQNWETFFAPSTPADHRAQLLQNGEQFKDVLKQEASMPMAKASQVKIKGVHVNGNQANVTYTIDLNGQPALQDMNGIAVKENGTWKVSRQTFCNLEVMSPTPPPACTGTGGQQK